MDDTVHGLALLPNGDVVAGGDFLEAGGDTSVYGVARWNGTNWSSIGGFHVPGVSAVKVLTSGDLVVGGYFHETIAGQDYLHTARWDGAAWHPMGTGFEAAPYAFEELLNGDVIAGGASANRLIARWNGTAWTSLGSGVNGSVWTLCTMANGDLVAGGGFSTAGGNISLRWARWSSVPECAADFNCSSSLEVQDIFDFLGAWFGDITTADLNHNGLDVQDIFDYLAVWFAGC